MYTDKTNPKGYCDRTRIVIMPYKMGSESGRALQDSIQRRGVPCLRVYPDGNYKPRPRDLIVNWGFSGNINWGNDRIDLNKPNAVKRSVNKLTAFQAMAEAGVNIPRFTTNRQTAMDQYKATFVRHNLTGHGGDGIEIVESFDHMPNAPLYVEAVDVKGEYRVHVLNGKVIDYVKKYNPEEDKGIKNHDNGYMFIRSVKRIPRVEEQAIKAVAALGLNFGAVDIVVAHDLQEYVLEVNTACGMEGTTTETYAESFIRLIN